MSKSTPGPWEWADVPSAGLQIRGPYKDSTRLMFSEIWRQFPELEWDATMVANTRLAAAAPELLEQLKLVLPILEGVNSRCTNDTAMILNVRAAIAKATGSAA